MANITIDVIGNTGVASQPGGGNNGGTSPSGGGNNGGTAQPGGGNSSAGNTGGASQPGGGGSSVGINASDNQRIVEDLRREMRQRGVIFVPGSNNVNQITSQYTQQLQQSGEEQIHSKYEEQRAEVRKRYLAQEKELEERKSKLDPHEREDYYEKIKIDKELDKLYSQRRSEFDDLNAKEKEEKEQYNKDVIARMQEVIELLKQESSTNPDNPNSYLGSLRKEQRELIAQREAATTREEAVDITRRLNGVNERLREATTGGDAANRKFFRDPALQTSQGLQDLFQNIGGGNIGGTINSLGTIGVGLSGASMGTALKALGWIGLIAGAAQGAWNIASGSGERLEGAADIAAWRATSGGKAGRAASEDVMGMLGGNILINGTSYTDLGYDRDEFQREAVRRIRQRGISENWYREVMEQLALERTFGLESGSLGAAGRFDRYGINATEGISGMMSMLMALPTSGVSRTDFTRVQEKFDIQQQIMQSYLSRTDRPDYNVANANLAAFSAVRGITQDSRLGSDYAVFQNAIQNPMNDRMRALIYNTVENIPGLEYTRGRPDLIARAITDPANEGKIIQQVVQTIKQIYGGTDTMMGFYAFRSVFPNISPDRLDAYIDAISNGDSDTAQLLKNGITAFPNISGPSDMAAIAQDVTDSGVTMSKEYQSQLLSTTRELRNTLNRIYDQISGNYNSPMNQNNGAREAGL